MLVSFLSLACLLLIPCMLLLAYLPFAGVPLALDVLTAAGHLHLHVSLTFAGVPCVDDKNGNRPMAEKQDGQDGTEILMRLTEQYLENSKRFQRSKQKL
jgi:hypothetical protein